MTCPEKKMKKVDRTTVIDHHRRRGYTLFSGNKKMKKDDSAPGATYDRSMCYRKILWLR
jgi:hypothetical protein